MSPDLNLSRLERVHADLERIYEILDHHPQLTPWEEQFLGSLDRQLHRGLALSAKQEAALTRIAARLSITSKGDEQ